MLLNAVLGGVAAVVLIRTALHEVATRHPCGRWRWPGGLSGLGLLGDDRSIP